MGGRLGIVMVVCCACRHLALEASEPARRPNVLILLTDDQRADTIAALGNPVIKTPNLDRLARSGFVFNNAYCLGSNSPAVCLPSRNMLLSGRYYFRWEGQPVRLGRSAESPRFDEAGGIRDLARRKAGQHGAGDPPAIRP